MKVLHSILIHPREAEPWISLKKRVPADWLDKQLNVTSVSFGLPDIWLRDA